MDDTESADSTTETNSKAIKLLEKLTEANVNSVAAKVTGDVLKDTQVYEMFYEAFRKEILESSEYTRGLSPLVKQHLEELITLQMDFFGIESQFYNELHELDIIYNKKYQSLYDKRRDIINGVMYPMDYGCKLESNEDGKELTKAKNIEDFEKTKEARKEKNESDENTSGIPDFWLKIFKNVKLLNSLVKKHDEPILKCLKDIQVKLHGYDDMGFTLEFVFAENKFFNNNSLSKDFIVESIPNPIEPLAFDGPYVIKCFGCTIDWKEGKNVTPETHTQMGKSAEEEIVNEPVNHHSFFDFFKDEDKDDDTYGCYDADYDIGHLLKNQIIPHAFLYFTGAVLDDEDNEQKVRSMDYSTDATTERSCENIVLLEKPTEANVNSEATKMTVALAAFEQHVNSMVRQGYDDSLPVSVNDCLKKLKQQQVHIFYTKLLFDNERHGIVAKYNKMYEPLYKKREDIINECMGSDCECEFNGDGKELTKAKKEKNESCKFIDINIKVFPKFWLRIFKTVDLLNSLVKEHDEPILKYLEDIRVLIHNDEGDSGFTLEFVFAKNDYFNNTVLTKKFIMERLPNAMHPRPYDGPHVVKCLGCNIVWKNDKNVTLEAVTRTQKGKSGKAEKVKHDSFFNFFNSFSWKEGVEVEGEDINILLNNFHVGILLKEYIIPQATLYFIEAMKDKHNVVKDDPGCYPLKEEHCGMVEGDKDPICKLPKKKRFRLLEDDEDSDCMPPKEKHFHRVEDDEDQVSETLNMILIDQNLIEDEEEEVEMTSSKDIRNLQKDKIIPSTVAYYKGAVLIEKGKQRSEERPMCNLL